MNCLFIIQIALTLMMLSPAQCFVTLSNKRKRLAFSTNKRLQISSLEGDLCGKVLAERFIYRLAPTKSTVSAPYAIEDRQYFSIGTGNIIKPLGDKCFFKLVLIPQLLKLLKIVVHMKVVTAKALKVLQH